ncbi:MAG TPA: hypothetical protein VHF47_10205 [Acidimicrobiales bacterium]|nr:hypothetical protein [Acidimicrobiales bacterium]
MEESWHAARLIPISGINGALEQERRAVSALLAVMTAVREFGRALLGPLGAPASPIESFIEVPFELDGRRHFPDGLLRARRGSKTWVALVEVKTGHNRLEQEQIESYLDIGRQHGYQAVLTISNEIPALPGTHPTPVDRRKTRSVALHHLSWTQVLTEAVMQKTHRGVADPDQAWVLGELIRYLEHKNSGAMAFEDMGDNWVSVREAAAHGTIRPGDKAALEVAGRWDQLIQFACLHLGKQLGVEVQPALSRRELDDSTIRPNALVQSLVSRGTLDGGLRIPGAVGPVTLCADVRAGRLTVSVDVAAPQEGRPRTRVNWLLRQLAYAPDDLRVDCFTAYARGASTSELLRGVRQNPDALIVDAKREIKHFRLALSAPMGTKRGQGRGGFVASVLSLLDRFYEDVVQAIKPWTAPPPKLRPPEPLEPKPEVPASLVSTAYSSQDGPEPAELAGPGGGSPAWRADVLLKDEDPV